MIVLSDECLSLSLTYKFHSVVNSACKLQELFIFFRVFFGCVFVYMFVFVWCMYACFLQLLSTLFLGQVLTLNLKLADLPRLAVQRVSDLCLSPSPQCWDVLLYPALQRGLREPTSGLYVCVGGSFLTELSP